MGHCTQPPRPLPGPKRPRPGAGVAAAVSEAGGRLEPATRLQKGAYCTGCGLRHLPGREVAALWSLSGPPSLWPAPPHSPAATARVEQSSRVTPAPRLPPAPWLRGLNNPKGSPPTRWWRSQLPGSRDKERSRRAWLCGGPVGSKAALKSPLLPHGDNNMDRDRRPGQELLSHQPHTQSSGVGTSWAARGSPGPSHHPNPPLDIWDGRYCMRWRGPRPPCRLSFSGRKVKVRHQRLAAEDGVKTCQSRQTDACLSGPTFWPRSQRQSMVQEKRDMRWDRGGLEVSGSRAGSCVQPMGSHRAPYLEGFRAWLHALLLLS